MSLVSCHIHGSTDSFISSLSRRLGKAAIHSGPQWTDHSSLLHHRQLSTDHCQAIGLYVICSQAQTAVDVSITWQHGGTSKAISESPQQSQSATLPSDIGQSTQLAHAPVPPCGASISSPVCASQWTYNNPLHYSTVSLSPHSHSTNMPSGHAISDYPTQHKLTIQTKQRVKLKETQREAHTATCLSKPNDIKPLRVSGRIRHSTNKALQSFPNGGSDCSNHRNASEAASSGCYKPLRDPIGVLSRWRCTITGVPITFAQILRLFVLLMTIHVGSLTVQGQDLGPGYKASRRMCLSDDECNATVGEVCWWAWDGCDKGECMCDPRNSFLDSSTDKCRSLKYGDEKCAEEDRCWKGMNCNEGFCRCVEGIMTSDKMFCLRENERLLGQSCAFNTDVCYQRATHGYTKKEVACGYDEKCHCDDGYKEDGPACRKWNVNEAGCDEDHHCQGGALCVDNICQCPSRYMPVARDSKCAKLGARYDLQIGEICDEINEERYCAFGLVCHQCAGDTHYSCVKFVEAEALPYHVSSACRKSSSTFQSFLATALVNLFISCHIIYRR